MARSSLASYDDVTKNQPDSRSLEIEEAVHQRLIHEVEATAAAREGGGRVKVSSRPVVPESPLLTVRKVRADRHKMSGLIGAGSMAVEVAEFLEACVTAKLSIVVSGGTGTGKTTLLNALSDF